MSWTVLFQDPAFQALLAGTLVHFLASVANALIPNESNDAGVAKRFFGKVIRGVALGVGQAIPKKAE